MEKDITEHQKQLDKEIQEVNKHIRMMAKVGLYTSFVLILFLTISAIIRGLQYGFT